VSWPPADLGPATPATEWYTPLLLSRHQAQTLTIRVSCSLPPALPRAARPLVVLATARDPVATGGLLITRDGTALRVAVGSATVERIPLRASGTTGCHRRIGFDADGRTMPVVDGLFSGLDLRRGAAPSVELTTTALSSRTTAVQTVVRVLGVLSVIAALLLVSGVRKPGRRARRRPLVAWSAVLADVTVVALLLVWWVFGPAFFDDGWIIASQRNFGASGAFSTYYDSFGISSSLQYWLSWLLHPLFDASSSLLVLRIPALICLVVTWFLCRWLFSALVPARTAGSVWALACAFLVGGFAWGMTVRPEPVVALLVAGVLVCTVRFVERGTTAPLAVAAVLIVLAVSAHPAGLVAIAPLIVFAPRLFAWARSRVATAATLVLSAVALLGVLAVLGSDLRHLHANAASLRTSGEETAGWRDELTRYSLLSRPLYGPPVRREWVVLALLAVFAYFLRRRGQRDELLDLPAPALGISLLLLIATPAKVPWHFGTLIATTALAVAAETARLVRDARATRGWHVRPFVVIGAGIVAAAWAWSPRNTWSDLDLRTLHWTLGFERRLTLAKVAGVAPLVVLGAFALVAILRRRSIRADPWRAAVWMVPSIALPVLAFTVAVLVADTRKTASWTLARQNLDTLVGRKTCGLADDAVIPARASMRSLARVSPAARQSASLPPPPTPGLPGFTLGAGSPSPWFALRTGVPIGFFLTVPSASAPVLALEWGTRGSGNVHSIGQSSVTTFADDTRPELAYWRFYAATEVPQAPAGADAVRLVSRSPGPVGVTAPVTYEEESLNDLLEHDRPALALPNLLAYVPCLRQPRVENIAGVPRLIVAFRNSMWPIGTGSSPFDGVSDVFRFVRLPLSDSQDPPADVDVYVVDDHISGAAIARPVVTTAR
jgi:Mycobacterial cell wall arabinan synthesis protein